MSQKTALEIKDEVNCKFHNLDVKTRRKLHNELRYFVPQARHMPSYKLGRWDGYVSYCSIAGQTYINLLDYLLPIVTKNGYEVEINDKRKKWNFSFNEIDHYILSHRTWPSGHQLEGQQIVLKDHQVKTINKFLKNTQGIQELPTAAGKTIITACLSYLVENHGRSIIVVPNKSLVRQTEEDYINIGLDVGVFYGDRKETDKQHIICTWQSLEEAFNKKSKEISEELRRQILSNVVCIMVDEVHQAKADILKKLLTTSFSHVPIRWGLSGTIPREENIYYSLIGTLGPLVNEVKPSELQEKGILSNCQINIIQTKEPYSFKDFNEERSYTLEDKRRLEWIANQTKIINQSGNTLILVEKIKTGKILEEFIEDSTFISGETSVKDREEHYQTIQQGENEILIGSFGIASVGINIRRIFNLIIIEPGKSFVRSIQSIGRGVRTADDKNFVNVWDFCSDTKYSKRHLRERKRHYDHVEYPYKVYKLDWVNGETVDKISRTNNKEGK